ncbi:MAG TPA: ChbG/HpnK family deacetylase [Xanthobacteraceae bacterium]|nr:ChbG/HpnK family deacetylase [Xanthobacteraceae bacterium]
MNTSARRHIVLCADDYGISPAVSGAIRDLIARRRINATSVMVTAPSFSHAEAAALREAAGTHAAIGLHLTLTGPFAPHTQSFAPLRHGAFLPLAAMAGRALCRSLQPSLLDAEIAGQLAAFRAAFGRAPDYVDGHQHIHVFPQISEALLRVAKHDAPQVWLRQCGRAARGNLDPKGFVLDALSRRFRRLAAECGMRTNAAFAGTYAFRPGANYTKLFPGFLDRLPDRGVVMCHPGKVDAELTRLDPLTDLREREYAFFLSEDFSRLLAANNVTLF